MVMGALSGGDPFEIIVALKDLASEGFGKIREQMSSTERAANTTNLSGFSGAAKTAEKDAAGAAKGIEGMAGGLVSMAGGPVGLAIAGVAAVAAAGIALTKTYDDIEVQEKALAIAAKDHGIAQEDLDKQVEDSIKTNERYGFGADDTRAAITKLTEAGMSLADQQAAMGPIADLARAKNLSLADAAKAYELTLMGNTRALKDLGIALPGVTDATKAQEAAQKTVDASTKALSTAQDQLATVEASLAGKHKLTASESLRLQQAQAKVSDASAKLQTDTDALGKVQDSAADRADRLTKINEALTGAVGGQAAAVSPLTVAQAKMGDTWERLAKTVGPPLETMFAGVLDVVGWLVDKFTDVVGVVGQVADWFVHLPIVTGPVSLAIKEIGFEASVLGNVFGWIVARLGDFVGWIGRAGQAVANSPIGGFIKMVADFVGGVAGRVGSIISSIGNAIPHFAAGGVVEPRAGGTVALLGEAGEREYVIPESRMGAMGGAVRATIENHLYLDGQELAFALERPQAALLNLRGTSAVNFGGA